MSAPLHSRMLLRFFLSLAFILMVGVNGNVSNAEESTILVQIKEMFTHGYDSYMEHAFPLDDLKPISCKGTGSGGYALTLIDTLDTLIVLGNWTEFAKQVKWISQNVSFDVDSEVSVFETNIRVLGGLLSAHIYAGYIEGLVPDYKGELLALAIDLAERLLPAFDTPTGVPYGSINLRKGVPPGETTITSVAGGGTHWIEFGVLSKLTGDRRYDFVARHALEGLWKHRSPIGLLGNHIDIFSGRWTFSEAGIGTGVDSFYEYLLKGTLLFHDNEMLKVFEGAYEAVLKHLRKPPWYVDVQMSGGTVSSPHFNSLQAFWSGLQVKLGDIEYAAQTLSAMQSVWHSYGFVPEVFNLMFMGVQKGHESYPLRPELAESAFMLYRATRDPTWQSLGRDMVQSIYHVARTKCGFATVGDVSTHHLRDHMESFFLSETLKYLYLLFDDANPFSSPSSHYIFSTEAHMFPLWIGRMAGEDIYMDAIFRDPKIAGKIHYRPYEWKWNPVGDMEFGSTNTCPANQENCNSWPRKLTNSIEILLSSTFDDEILEPLIGTSSLPSYFRRLNTPGIPLANL